MSKIAADTPHFPTDRRRTSTTDATTAARTPTTRKLWIYGIIIIGFLVICAGYLWIVYRSANQSARNTAVEWVDMVRKQVAGLVEAKFDALRVHLIEHHPTECGESGERLEVNERRLYPMLREMSRGQPRNRFYYVDPNGMLHDHDGAALRRRIDSAVLRRASEDNATLAEFFDAGDGRREIAEIVPLFPGANQYLVRTGDIGGYARSLLGYLGIHSDYCGFFDSDTRMTAWREREEKKVDDDIRDSIITGADEFSRKNIPLEIVQTGFMPDFNVYFVMNKAEGWIFATHLRAVQLLPFFLDMVASSLVIFAVVLFLIVLIIALDIVNDREKALEIRRVSSLDPLTSLYNELGVQEALEARFRSPGLPGAFLIAISIVSFRRFNSMHGFAAGDELLRVIGGVLKSRYAYSARISGGLFLCVSREENHSYFMLDAHLRTAVGREIGRQYLQMPQFKYGVYRFTESGNVFGDVYDACMIALQEAQKSPSQIGAVYDEALHKKSEIQKKIEVNMLHALSNEEFVPYVQPKLDTVRDVCAGGEALVRWQSQESGITTPDNFIPLFERNGFIIELDFFMLGAVSDMLRRHCASGIIPLPLSVNQSRVTISFPNYLERLRNLVERCRTPTRYVELEITESCLEDDFAATIRLIHSLKDMGFTIAMDDFGAGYSSLNTLRELQVDVLKLDKNFLRMSDNSDRSRKIIKSIINMAADLDIRVVCEGVETEAQLDFLTSAGCNLIQGYYYARPMIYHEYELKYLNLPPEAPAAREAMQGA